MASRKIDPTGSPQHATEKYQGGTTAELQTQEFPNINTNFRESELGVLPVQAAEGSDFAMKQFQDLAQAGASVSFPALSPDKGRSESTVYSSISSSDGGNLTLTPASPSDVNTSPSPSTYLSTSPASGSQSISLPPLRQLLEPHHPPPTSSAVTSPLTSPVTPILSWPRHWQSNSLDNPLDSTAPEGSDEAENNDSIYFRECNLKRDSSEYDGSDDASKYGHDESCSPWNDGNDSTNRGIPVKDDVGDVMNFPINEGGGFVVPRIDGITSLNSDEVDFLTEASLDGEISPRCGASPTGQVMSHLATPSSVRNISNPHVQFATNTSVQDTPFAKTLKYFKQFKDKENTPLKSRRNASLPKEIAELAKDAQQEGIEDDKALWDKYRELDFAPLDPVMDGQTTGDLITGAPVCKTVASDAEGSKATETSRVISVRPKSRGFPGDDKNNDQTTASLSLNDKVIEGHANETGPTYLVNIPGHFDDAFQLRFRSRASVGLIASFLHERGEALDASKDDIDRLVKEFLERPSNYITRGPSDTDPLYADSDHNMNPKDNEKALGTGSASCDDNNHGHNAGDQAHDKEIISYPEDPVFVKALGMVPEAMFWAVAQSVARYSKMLRGATSKAFDTALQKLTGLSLDEPLTSE